MPAVGSPSGRIVGQTTAMCAYLGSEIGLGPPPGLEFDAMKIACDVADIWSEGYAKRKSRDAEVALQWLGSRFVRFVQVIDATRAAAAHRAGVADPGTDWPFLLGAAPCYVDFLWLNALITMEFCFGPKRVARALGSTGAVGAVAAAAATRARPKVAAHLAAGEPVGYQSIAFAALFGGDDDDA